MTSVPVSGAPSVGDTEVGVQLWTWNSSMPGRVAPDAEEAEREGWDGLTFVDSPLMTGDPFVAMMAAARATTSLRLATGVISPVTRHPAVAAAAVAAVDAESGGRAELGVGRGDPSLARLGAAPASLRQLADYLDAARSYLGADTLPAEHGPAEDDHRAEQPTALADLPRHGQMSWLRRALGARRPAVFAVASGPRAMRVASRHADRVALAVGADPSRLCRAIEVLRAGSPTVPVAAYVNVVVADSGEAAFELARTAVAALAPTAKDQRLAGDRSAHSEAALQGSRDAPEGSRHFAAGADAAAQRFAVLGDQDTCTARLLEIAALGIDRLHIVCASTRAPAALDARLRRRFEADVLPQLHPLIASTARP